METILQWGGLALLAVVLGTVLGILTAFPTMLVWNALVPELFGLQAINFTQALLLNLLSSILFKSWGSSSSK